MKNTAASRFAKGSAVYYGGRGYSTHRTEAAAIAASKRDKEYSHEIIDTAGQRLLVCGDKLVKGGNGRE